MEWIDLEQYKHARPTMRPNYTNIPVTVFEVTKEGAEKFNEIYRFLLEQKNMRPFVRTPSGGISIKKGNFFANHWDIRVSGVGVEITVAKGYMWRFQFRHKQEKDEGKLYGRQAFRLFKKLCLDAGIDLEEYAITREEGQKIKETIPQPKIELGNGVICKDKVYQHCYHADFHNSYPAGLCNTHEEFRKVIEPLYLARKQHAEYKAVLNYTIGFMQRKGDPRWAHLSKDAISDNLKRVLELEDKIRRAGYRILAFNTDGIWYQDIYYMNKPYHGEGEGKGLGQWENDHCDCKLRFKSKGSYEFMENGEYHPVVRGMTRLDAIKPRSEWKWGDIFQDAAQIIKYQFIEGEGIIYEA